MTPPSGSRRTIPGGPVFGLAVLQGMVADGVMSENEVWVATDRCERDLENERWSYDDVLHLLSCLQPADFKNAEWCRVKGGALYPCDVYRFGFDFERRARNARGLEVYMKFSVTEDGQLSLVLVSCHGSR
ncbi:MAG: hypothetical protein E6Q93_03710 [Burkholderiaceae bacterium]|nr:MAG: hypothetical protein E6Q93_03710 [Burkholderiaceae bacterium]